MRPRAPAAVLSVGTELTSGRLADAHGPFLASEVRRLGGRVLEIRAVPDDQGAIVRALRELSREASLLVVTGGLGPTEDDRTREALARAARVPLVLHPPSLEAIGARFRRLGRTMAGNNRRQALLPRGARAIPNPKGTAPGIRMRLGRCRVLAMPGVPHEMRAMWRRVRPRGVPSSHAGRLLHCIGLPESEVDRRIGHLMRPGRPCEVGVTVSGGIVTISIAAWGRRAATRVRADASLVRASLGNHLFGKDGETLAEAVVRTLARRRQTLALAESATGGLVSAMVTAVPGASHVLLEARTVYSAAAKRRLGVPATLLSRQGPVSEAVTVALARRIRRTAGATWGLAVTGVAGPSGGSTATPVGTFLCSIDSPGGTESKRWSFRGSRTAVQWRSALSALDLVREACRMRGTGR